MCLYNKPKNKNTKWLEDIILGRDYDEIFAITLKGWVTQREIYKSKFIKYFDHFWLSEKMRDQLIHFRRSFIYNKQPIIKLLKDHVAYNPLYKDFKNAGRFVFNKGHLGYIESSSPCYVLKNRNANDSSKPPCPYIDRINGEYLYARVDGNIGYPNGKITLRLHSSDENKTWAFV